MEAIGWLVIGFLAGALSAMVVPNTSARGCLPIARPPGRSPDRVLVRELRLGDPGGFWGALLVAVVGAVLVRMLIGLTNGRQRR